MIIGRDERQLRYRCRLIVMGCHCDAGMLKYDQLLVIPQNEHEWEALLSEWIGDLSFEQFSA